MKLKKVVSIVIVLMIMFSLTVCVNATEPNTESTVPPSIEENNPENNEGNNDQGNNNDNTGESNPGNNEQNKEENKEPENSEQNGNEENNQQGSSTTNNQNNGSQAVTSGNQSTGSTSSTNKNKTTGTNNKTETKSGNANLKSLKTDIEGLTPEFDKDVTEYYLTVDLSVTKVDVDAEKDDDAAKVLVTGNKKLQEGENTIKIEVTAENGLTKTYYIYVTKTDSVEKANTNLKALSVEGYEINPEFKADTYNYNLTIEEEVESLNIVAEVENEKASIEIKGNENLKNGKNTIEVIVTAEDGVTVKTYKLNVDIGLIEEVEIQEENKTPAVIAIVVLVVVIIFVGICIIKKNRR